jgi:NAD(P)-dependent dehydrogenase (short-subunit alcohol dehydrogenase family)
LYITALAFAVARRWSKVLSNAVDPGWVPTKMGGRGAPDDLEEGHLTQTWLAVSEEAAAKTSGGLWFHRKRQQPAEQSLDPRFQDELLAKLAQLTGVKLA